MRVKGRVHYINADMNIGRTFEARCIHATGLRLVQAVERSLWKHAEFDRLYPDLTLK